MNTSNSFYREIKLNKTMERQELIAQYDKFISQVREEIRELYWLYNFFFIIESSLMVAVFTGNISENYLSLAKIIGLLFSCYWFWIIRKQKLWRDNWLSRIVDIEAEIKYSEEFSMWPKYQSSFIDFLIRKNGLWQALFFLPIGFAIMWLILLFCRY